MPDRSIGRKLGLQSIMTTFNSIHIPPTFYIIGERKCGTSSLYRYLIHHPNVLPCALKEPNFFGKGTAIVEQTINDYWQLFPPKDSTKDLTFLWPELNNQGILYHEDVTIPRLTNQMYITGEASANTFYEVSPRLVHQYLPDIKLVLLFRHPVQRAYSHYRMYRRFQEEGRDLGFAVRDFKTEVQEEMAAIRAGKKGEYLSPSIYIHQLKEWVDTFGKDHIRIYFSEDLKNPNKVVEIMADLQRYLALPYYAYGDYLKQHFNKAPKASMPPSIYEELSSFFRPYNEELFDFLKIPVRWGQENT